ncbi:MAG: immunoglobulin domain-containing protein [Kiritimatiellae bacterium]|nr:immunoglobulin domain-containing protein [Kiritimatiellia bacterium]
MKRSLRIHLIALPLLTLLARPAAADFADFSEAWSTYASSSPYTADTLTALAIGPANALFAGGRFGYAALAHTPVEEMAGGGTDQMEAAGVIKLDTRGRLKWAAALGDRYDGDTVLGLAASEDQTFAACVSRPSADPETSHGLLVALNGATGEQNWSYRMGIVTTGTNAFTAVTLTPDGDLFAVGHTTCPNLAHNISPVTVDGVAYGAALQGETDAFAARFAPDGTLLWLRYLGGVNGDTATACCAGADGSLYIGGETHSPDWATYPSGAPSPETPSGFLARLSPDGELIWATFLCGEAPVTVTALTAHPTANLIYLGGTTQTQQFTPASGSNLRNLHSGRSDGFILQITPSETRCTVNWTRFIGGDGEDTLSALTYAADEERLVAAGTVRTACETTTDGSTFQGITDGFVAAIPASGLAPTWWGYQGGGRTDASLAVAVTSNALYTAGETLSEGWVTGGFDPLWEKDVEWGGGAAGFIKKWAPPSPPVIDIDLEDQTQVDGGSLTFTLDVWGTLPIRYFWYWNEILYAETATATLTLEGLTMDADGSTLLCVMTNWVGTAQSRTATITVTNYPPVIVSEPEDATAYEYQPTTWSVAVDGGSSQLAYLWYRDGEPLQDAADGSDYTLPSPTLTDDGATFFCVISNLSGCVTSRVARLTVTDVIPAITTHPADLTVMEGDPASWTIEARGGSAPLHYQWYRDGTAIPGATSSTYTLSPTTRSDSGATFFCTVSNPGGSVTSEAATLTVDDVYVFRTLDGTNVTLTVTPPDGTTIWTVEEPIPEGLTPLQPQGGAMVNWNASTRTLTWLGMGTAPATLTYALTGDDGTYLFSGQASFGGAYLLIGGTRTLTLPLPAEIPIPTLLALRPLGESRWRLTFISAPGVTYAIQTNATLSATGWATAAEATATGDTETLILTLPPPTLFIRVKAPLP